MKSVADIPFKDLTIGTKVIGASGVHGAIIDLVLEEPGTARYDEVSIDWDNGNQSYKCFHHRLTKVLIAE